MAEGEAVRPSVIKRWECPEHGDTSVFWPAGNEPPECMEDGCTRPQGERVYWAADEVLEALKYGRFPGAAGHLLRRFSGEGAS